MLYVTVLDTMFSGTIRNKETTGKKLKQMHMVRISDLKLDHSKTQFFKVNLFLGGLRKRDI